MFQRQADQHWAELNRFNQNHIAGQSEQFMAQKEDAYVAARQNAGALAGSTLDYAGIAKAAQDVEDARRVAALKNGRPTEVNDIIIAKDVSHVYAGAITSMLNAQQDQAAKKFFDENKDRLTKQDRDHIEPKLVERTELGEAYRIVDSVYSQAADFTEGSRGGAAEYANVNDALDAVRRADGSNNPKVRQMAEHLAKQRWEAQRLGAKIDEDKRFEGAAEEFRKTGDFEALQRSEVWDTLPERDKEHLESMAAKLAKTGSVYSMFNDPKILTEFYGMSREEIASLSKADMLRRASSVKEGEFVDMMKHWQGARNKEEDATFTIKAEDEKRIFDQARDAGLAGLKKVDKLGNLGKKAEAYTEIREEAAKRLRAEAAASPNQRVPQERREKIIDDLIIEKRAKEAESPIFSFEVGGTTVALERTWLKVTDAERERINQTVKRLTGKDASDQKIRLLKRLEMMKAGPELLRRVAAE
jgi:hypothetical protein